jgi:hypothetical protein
MGLLEGMLGPRGGAYKQPLDDIDGVVGAWSAARTGGGGLSIAGGQLVLTDSSLVFSPWDLDKTRAFLVKWLSKAGVPHVATIDKALTASKLLDPVVLPIADVARVEVLNRASLLKPPRARIALRDGRHFDVGILSSATAPNFSPANNVALDDFVARLP